MRILTTFPGKFGDLLWALPTVRALSEAYGVPVDLQIAGDYERIAGLIERQEYIDHVWADHTWAVQQTAPISPRTPPRLPDDSGFTGKAYDRVYHLGYKGWPSRPLPFQVEAEAWRQFDQLERGGDSQGSGHDLRLPEIDLNRRWIRPPAWALSRHGLAIGFTDEHFELKYGLHWLLYQRWPTLSINVSSSPRWQSEGGRGAIGWDTAACWIESADIFVGCCSALHVLARAMGKPVILLEPAPERHHPIFYPQGTDGPQVTLVKGLDGKPTFDARHLIDAIDKRLRTITPAQELPAEAPPSAPDPAFGEVL
jgi:hypothetical protein